MTKDYPPTNSDEPMMDLIRKLFPINRSLTGEGVRQTLAIIRDIVSDLQIHEVPSGFKAFDWTVPDEWNVSEAYLITPNGEKICDYSDHNLHLVSYSTPIEITMPLHDLQSHLFSLPDQPDAIPYVTSYYDRTWGFCLPHRQRELLKEGNYAVVIRGSLETGFLNYGELYIPSTECTKDEVFISTYVCHPSMANNELSGPVVAVFLTRWLLSRSNRRFNYRFVFVPETIGSLVYLSQHYQKLKENVIAGFNLTCLGDDRCYSFVPSRSGDSLADKVALHVLKHQDPHFNQYSFLDRGSDERQYCAPGIDLPVVTICRSKYHCFPEYHTSLDNLDLVSEVGLAGSLSTHQLAIECIEENYKYRASILGEPQLSKRNLYEKDQDFRSSADTELLLNIMAYSDGQTSLLEIADLTHTPMHRLLPIRDILVENKLLDVLV